MKFSMIFLLSALLVSCGKSSETKTTKESLKTENQVMSDAGVILSIGSITTSSKEQVMVICNDTISNSSSTTNKDRIDALNNLLDSLRGDSQVEFEGGKRVSVEKINMIINTSISTLQVDPNSTTCPMQVLANLDA